MGPELTALALSGLLQLAIFVAAAVRANFEIGSAWFLGPRDRPPDREVSVATGRLRRASENMREWLPPFAIGVVAVVLADASTAFTAACAWTFLAARVLYVPAYLYGWVPGRSLVWAVGFAATAALLLAALFGGGA